MRNVKRISIALLGLIVFSGCSSNSAPEVVYETQIIRPGAAQFVWEEPMVDVIDVPPGLDPDGVYYRPAHQQVVEIRQGRWKYYKGSEQEQK